MFAEALPVGMDEHFGAEVFGNGDAVILAARIENDHFVRPGHRVQAIRQQPGFVLGDDHHRQAFAVAHLMAPWRQVRFQQLQQALQRSLILIQHFHGVAAVIAAIVFVGEQSGDFLDQRVLVGHGDQPFGLR